VIFYLGDADAAVSRAHRAVELIEESEEPWFVVYPHMNLGYFATWAGEFDTARASLRSAYPGMQQLEGYTSATIVDKFARLAYATGQLERAAALLAFADATFENNGVVRQRREALLVEAMRGELQELLGGRFEEHYRRGRAMNADESAAEVFEV
jgi:Flp pilus assembly protein TadD